MKYNYLPLAVTFSLTLLQRLKFFNKMSSRFTPVTHVLFDLDGTILDTEILYANLYAEILDRYGKEYTQEIKLAVTGVNKLDGSRALVEMAGLPLTPQELYEQIQERRFSEIIEPNLKMGAEFVIRHLHSNSVPIAVATSSSKESYETKTAKHKELFKLFHHITNGSNNPEVAEGKPAPDIFLLSARSFDVPAEPKKCLVFEDSPNGVTAGIAAGMQVVMIPDVDLPRDRTLEATLVIESFLQFEPEDFGLPPYPVH